MKKSYILILLLLSGSVFGQADAKFRKIDSLLRYLQANNKFMGSVAIRESDKIVFAKAYGFSDIANQKVANPDTKYKVGSITKPFTAVVLLQLVDEKKIKLEDKLSKFYPKVKNADQITIEMLLRHRSGIHEILGDSIIAENIQNKMSKAQLVDVMNRFASDFTPDSKYTYSNSNYILLGFIIEDVTKKSYSENLQTRIIKKIGLKNTYLPEKTDHSKNEASSAIFVGNKWNVIPEWSNSIAFSAGALVSTPSDLTQFTKALFDGKLMSAASFEKMKTLKDTYGLGLIALPFDNKKFYGHTGGIENFRSVTGFEPESKMGFALCINGDNFDRNAITLGILQLYYGQDYKFPEFNEIAVSESILQTYVGNYASSAFPLKIRIFIENGKLSAQATGQGSFALEAESDTKFAFKPAGIKLEFSHGKMNLKQNGLNVDFNRE
ncbi:serine hydrolase [Flavobacterium sp.]|uniref:serine hydrolase domain-containing protein n=1 Tax=Flavobacterium sp. TaxID=239 RepID=UPI0012225FF9|nr:serine hydrolase domain-containing protein [Flavobacterium sp.]RZJ73935.1 MAG: class A beta-lactamase-related serine hydrolase [Flavobacterium sp.]